MSAWRSEHTGAGRLPGALASALREPLLQFLALGAALFALYAWADRGQDAGPGGAELVVTASRVQGLAETFARQWGRPPSDAEVAGLVRDFVREELLAREAVALGLDRDDTIVRRRLAQKMEFLADDVAAAVEPTDAELAAFLAAHPDRFRVEARFTFDQIFLDRQARGDRLAADAAALLAVLNAPDGGPEPAALGDGRLLPPRKDDGGRRDVEAQFGPGFVERLAELPLGRFVWPVESGYGPHLVRVVRRTPDRAPALHEVRDDVAREWAAAKRREAQEAHLQALLARYRVTIEPAPALKPGDLAARTR